MEFRFLLIFASLSLASWGSCHCFHPAELYWKSVLPNTPVPKYLQDLLRPGKVGNALAESLPTDMDIVIDSVVTTNSLTDIANSTEIFRISKNFYFLEKDLRPGRKVDLPFTEMSKRGVTFLPRQVAELIPFSSNKFQDILNLFSLKPETVEANTIKRAIAYCEAADIKEHKFCATSIESMVDLTISKLGKEIQVLSLELEKDSETNEFTVAEGVKMVGEKDRVVCHRLSYPYALFYCHTTPKTQAYSVPLVGSDGTKIKAHAVCHRETSDWHPMHWAIQILNIKPGTAPVCHFLPKALMFIPNRIIQTSVERATT